MLQDKPANLDDEDCYSTLIADTSTFSKEDIQIIKQIHAKPLITYWTSEMFSKVKFVKKTTIDSIFAHGDGWNYFYKHIGRGFNTFSAPVFLRNYSWCLIYTSDHCGWLCASGRVTLYQRSGETWAKVKSWCNWIS